MNKNIVLILAGILIVLGFVKPNFINKPVDVVDTIVVITPPADNNLRKLCEPVIKAFDVGSPNKKQDAKRLSDLYMDIATLISLDQDDETIKTTEEIRQVNSLSGVMLRLNIKGIYPDLTKAAQDLISSQIGDDMVPLDSDLRSKAVDAFRALSWACNESSK